MTSWYVIFLTAAQAACAASWIRLCIPFTNSSCQTCKAKSQNHNSEPLEILAGTACRVCLAYFLTVATAHHFEILNVVAVERVSILRFIINDEGMINDSTVIFVSRGLFHNYITPGGWVVL